MASANETEIFQHYQVLKKPDGALWELGRGAMGITYKAFDTNLRCDVALKVINALHLDSETARARFLREARAAAGLRHRNVASVYHLGNDDQSFFYAMEFVDGETVECLVKETGPMPPVDALQIIVQIARALGAAAKQNLVHRDIKPANIMVMREEDEEEQFVVKVIDFGLARPALGGEGSAHITMGGFVGTPQFASPEQLEEKDLDARSDIYSLGVTLWFMLAAKPPFTGPLGSVFIQQLTKEPPWAQLEGTPEPVLKLLAGMLQKEPDKRPQTPVELRRQVEACLRQLPAADRLLAPAKSAADDESADSVTSTETPETHTMAAWTVGGILADRYELAELAGDGTNGRVFRAVDRRQNGETVAIKILHSDVLASSAERRRLEGELEKLRTAPHPYLIDYTGLREAADTSFLVAEWVHGFTLVDLLRSRGQLPLEETLCLVAQAAVAADHARNSDLRRLELSLHQIMAGFSDPAGGVVDSRAALSASIDQWPPYALKLDALGIAREAGDSVTWGGDMTMMPSPALLGRDTQTSIRGFVEGSDLFALGLMTYELLSGAPPAHSQRAGGREARYVALPALNEAANLVLRRALSPNPGFATNVDFFKALVDASGLPQTFLDETAAAEPDPFAVERLPVSGAGAEDAGATLILEDGESISSVVEPATMRGPSPEERARAEQAEAERAEQEKLRAEREAAERAEDERIRVERAEAQRLAAQRANAERIEAQRVAAEKAEAERIEAQRAAAEKAEAERIEAERQAAERQERERIAAQEAEARRLEAQRLAAERAEAKRVEDARIAAERAEAARRQAERQAVERAEAERIAAQKAEADRIEAERLAAERAEAKRLEAERLQAEKAEAERIRAERAEAKRLEAEKIKAEKAEAARIKAEQAEAKRLEAEKIKADKAEAKRLQLEQARAEKAESERQRAAAAALRDVAGVSAGEDFAPAAAGQGINKKVLAGVAGGLALLVIMGVVMLSRGHRSPEPVAVNPVTSAKTVVEPTPAPVVQPTPDEPRVAAVIPTPTPELPMAEASPTAAPTPEATPAIAEATPTEAPAPTPEPPKRRDEPDDRVDPRAAAKADRVARQQQADEKKRREAAAADAERLAAAREQKERDREAAQRRAAADAAASAQRAAKKTTVAVSKPKAEKPKPTPEPANAHQDAVRFSPLR